MYETKLANSIQQDYRQAADTYRMAQAVAPKTKINNWKTITFIAVLAMSSVIIALQPTITYASGNGGHVGG